MVVGCLVVVEGRLVVVEGCLVVVDCLVVVEGCLVVDDVDTRFVVVVALCVVTVTGRVGALLVLLVVCCVAIVCDL